MWKKKKFIVIAVLAAVLTGVTIGGVAMAQSGDSASGNATSIFDRVAAILSGEGVNVTGQQLQDAFKQAGKEARDEALQKQLDKLVENGRLTQEQADQYKAWIQSRPDVPLGPGGFGRFGMKGGRFGFRGMHGHFGGPVFIPPTQPTQ